MGVDEIVRKAIEEGQAILDEKKREAARKETEEAKQRIIYNQQAQLAADKWAVESLPGIIRNETAAGNRRYRTYSDFQATAAQKLGLKTTSEWLESWHDEGIQFGGCWVYYIEW